MANPKRRHSRSRRDKRRANWRLTEVSYITCKQCEAIVLPHRACSKCGFYDGKLAVTIKSKVKKTTPEKTNQEVSTSEQK